MSDQDVISAGRAALARIEENGRKLFADYVLVGDALVVGRSECLKLSGSNSLQTPAYRKCLRQWLDANGFGSMDGGARDDAMWLSERKAEVTRWRDGLSEAARRNCNHPNTVRVHFERGTEPQRRGPKAKPPRFAERDKRPEAAKKDHCGPRPQRPEGDLIRRVATAMRSSGKSDWYQLATVAIEALSVEDLYSLLPTKAERPAQLAMELHA
jgi:hypothetical protein